MWYNYDQTEIIRYYYYQINDLTQKVEVLGNCLTAQHFLILLLCIAGYLLSTHVEELEKRTKILENKLLELPAPVKGIPTKEVDASIV